MRKARKRRRERRRRPRQPPRFTAASVCGRVVDWSPRGVAVETHDGMRVGGRYDLRLGSRGRPLDLRGTVRWCRLSSTRRLPSGEVLPVYRAGLRVEGRVSALPGGDHPSSATTTLPPT